MTPFLSPMPHPLPSRFKAIALALALPFCASPAFARGEAQAYPLGATDAWGYVLDGDSLRVQDVRSGGPLDDSGVRNRDEIIGVQVGRQFVPFKGPPKTYMRILGEGIDAAMEKGGSSLRFKMRLGRDQGFATVDLPKYGKFVAGHVIDKMTVEGKENKNELFLKGCGAWLAKKNKAGQLGVGHPMNPGLSWAGLALMGSPDPDHEKLVGKWVAAIQADWARPGKRPNHGLGKDSYGQTLFSDIWGVLLLSEYNWRHPDYDRKAVLEKACDEMAQLVLNPSYIYKEPSWHKNDPGTVDPGNPDKEYFKDRFAYAKGAVNPRNLAVAWWCWAHCAETSGVEINKQALEVAHQHLLDLTMPADANGRRAFPKGKDGSYAFRMDRETASYFANALVKSKNKDEAKIGEALTSFVNRSPFFMMGDQSEFGMLSTCCLWARTKGAAGCKERFNEWRWYLGLSMTSQGKALFCQLIPDPPPWEPNPLGNKEIDAHAISAFLLAAPARRLLMTGAEKPAESLGSKLDEPTP